MQLGWTIKDKKNKKQSKVWVAVSKLFFATTMLVFYFEEEV